MARGRDMGPDMPKAKITKDGLSEVRAIFRYMLPYRGYFIGGLLVTALSAGTTLLFPALLKKLIDSANGDTGSAYGYGPGAIAGAMMGLLVLQMFISFWRVYMFTYVGENAVADMRRDIYNRLLVMPMDFFAHRRVGELSSRITADVSQIQDVISVGLAEILRGILTIVIGTFVVLYISPKMTLLMLSVIPVIIAVALIFSKFIRKMSRQAQDQLADSGTIAQETLQGIANVKSFSNEWYEVGRYATSLQSIVRLAMKNGIYRGLFIACMLFCVFGTIVWVVWYGVQQMLQHHMTFGVLTQFAVYIAFIGFSLAGFADLYTQLQKVVGATQRVRELLSEPIEDIDIKDVQLSEEFRLNGAVSLRDIRFSYPSRRELEIVKGISIDARRGEQVAIVGPSGAGKSTLVSLLLRLYEPDSGELLFDGRPAASIPLTQLRKQIALVPQDILLFGGTIYENIAYGKPGSSLDEVKEAAKKANAHEFITSFPEGYNTIVGERGVKLSGGQRQRIAIARAILKDPVILLLDEATSSLDSESEVAVQEALHNLMQNRTSFVIAHRLSTIRNADQIIVLEDGKVKERGTHKELINIEEGLYRNLNKLQLFEG